MRRTDPFALSALLLATASAVHATDDDLRLGIRSFGPDHERWPVVGFSARIGPDGSLVKPTVPLSFALDLVYVGSITEASRGRPLSKPSRVAA